MSETYAYNVNRPDSYIALNKSYAMVPIYYVISTELSPSDV